MTVHSLFSLSVKVIFNSIAAQKTCMVLPPTLLQYLLYQAVRLMNVSWIQNLLRHWPWEILSFDFDRYIDEDTLKDDERCELYLRRHHSWFYSPSFPQIILDRCIIDSIAIGLYLRLYHCRSAGHATSETKQFIVDLSMVGARTEVQTVVQPFVDLCCGKPPSEILDSLTSFDSDTSTSIIEKALIHLGVYNDHVLRCLSTSPCALVPKHFELNCFLTDAVDQVINSLQALENISSVCFQTDSKSVAVCTKILGILQKKTSLLNEITIISLIDDQYSNEDLGMPLITCQRIKLVTYGSLNIFFTCVYAKLQSLHICVKDPTSFRFGQKLNSEIFKIITHNCMSLIDLHMSGVSVTKNDMLLQEAFKKCHALVVLNIKYLNNGTLASVRLHEIFHSMQGLCSLEYLHITEDINVFEEDLRALHDLLYQALPKLTNCCLSFHRLIVYFTSLGNVKYKCIQELLSTLLSGKQPSPDCHTVAFRWRSNQIIHDWLTGLRRCVNFRLL